MKGINEYQLSSEYLLKCFNIIACANGHKDIVEMLLSNSADAKLEDNWGVDALSIGKLKFSMDQINENF